MSPTVCIFGCVALVAVVLFSNLCAYKFGKYQGWLDAFRQDTPYGKEGMHLRDGETFLGVGGCATRSVFLHR